MPLVECPYCFARMDSIEDDRSRPTRCEKCGRTFPPQRPAAVTARSSTKAAHPTALLSESTSELTGDPVSPEFEPYAETRSTYDPRTAPKRSVKAGAASEPKTRLVPCRDCDTQISPKARSCPNCGRSADRSILSGLLEGSFAIAALLCLGTGVAIGNANISLLGIGLLICVAISAVQSRG